MKKKTILGLLILSLVLAGVGIYLLKFYNCGYSTFCYNLIDQSKALFYGMSALALVFFILLFSPKAIPAWKRFARWFIPIAALIFIFYKGPGGSDLFSPYPEQVYQWVSGLYVVLSILIIGVSAYKMKTKSN